MIQLWKRNLYFRAATASVSVKFVLSFVVVSDADFLIVISEVLLIDSHA